MLLSASLPTEQCHSANLLLDAQTPKASNVRLNIEAMNSGQCTELGN